MVCLEDDSSSLAEETLTIFEEKDEGVPERVPSFVIEFVRILLRVAMGKDR